MSDVIPYADQAASVRREIGLRERVYPRRVAGGQMTQALADRELERMRAVLRTLEIVEAINVAALEAGDPLPAAFESLIIRPADLGRLL